MIDTSLVRREIWELLPKNINNDFNCFHGLYKPYIPIDAYIYRVLYYTEFPEDISIYTLIYLKRIDRKLINDGSIHRLFLSSFVIASKYCEDDAYGNDIYAKIGGINKRELQRLELAFLDCIKFNLNVNHEEYDEQLKRVSKND